jgi:hypothetical protein
VHTDPETYATSVLCPKCYEKMKAPNWYQNKRILALVALVAMALVALAFGLGFGLSNVCKPAP